VTRREPTIFRNVPSNWALFVVSVVVSFFLSPFVIHHLGNTGFGVWVLIVSITSYLQFVDLGVRNAVTRYVSKFHAQGGHESASAVVSTAVAVFLAGGVLVMIAAGLAALYAMRLFNIAETYQQQAACTYTFERLLRPTNLVMFFLQVGVALPLRWSAIGSSP
jgi:O-antigen/teichoic acid export membrane protein